MLISHIVNRINTKLAGETLTYGELRDYMDEVIDDINAALNSKFPVFSEVESNTYDFFPDKYIRKVVVVGAAYKYYLTDEEGAPTAVQYGQQYQENLFEMVRDYSIQVPEEYQNFNGGFLVSPEGADRFIPNPWLGKGGSLF